jgi:hypothetical protein
VPEQLALDERRGDRGAVHGDERSLAPLGEPVQRSRHELLPGAGLAEDGHGRLGGRDALDEVEDVPHRGLAGDHPLEGRGGWRGAAGRDLEDELDIAQEQRRPRRKVGLGDAQPREQRPVRGAQVAHAPPPVAPLQPQVMRGDERVVEGDVVRGRRTGRDRRRAVERDHPLAAVLPDPQPGASGVRRLA